MIRAVGPQAISVDAPWLVIDDVHRGDRANEVRILLHALDRVWLVSPRGIVIGLACGDLKVELDIHAGNAVATQIATAAAPHTRQSADTPYHVDIQRMLRVGDEWVTVEPSDTLRIGQTVFALNDVRACAHTGGNLRLPRGRVVQAAVALLVVAAADRGV